MLIVNLMWERNNTNDLKTEKLKKILNKIKEIRPKDLVYTLNINITILEFLRNIKTVSNKTD